MQIAAGAWQIQFLPLELSRTFSPLNIFNLWLAESIDAEPMDREGQQYNGKNKICWFYIWNKKYGSFVEMTIYFHLEE